MLSNMLGAASQMVHNFLDKIAWPFFTTPKVCILILSLDYFTILHLFPPLTLPTPQSLPDFITQPGDQPPWLAKAFLIVTLRASCPREPLCPKQTEMVMLHMAGMLACPIKSWKSYILFCRWNGILFHSLRCIVYKRQRGLLPGATFLCGRRIKWQQCIFCFVGESWHASEVRTPNNFTEVAGVWML